MKRHILTILTSILLLSASGSLAHANDGQCATDQDCGPSQVCVEVTSGCPPPCRPGDDSCEPMECNPGKSSMCQQAPPSSCDSNDDCGTGLVCITHTETSCSGNAGSPTIPCSPEEGPDCNDTPPVDNEPESECETTSVSLCGPPYIAPCTDDASCGTPGFTCVPAPADDCACQSPPPGPDENNFDCQCPEPDVSEDRDGYCELENISCGSDTDCENGFICHNISSPAPDASCTFDVETGVETCDDPNEGNNYPNIGRCAPADYLDWVNVGHTPGGGKDESATDTGGSHNNAGGNSNNADSDPNTANSPGSDSPDQDDPALDLSGDVVKDSDDGCHIASLNTGKTSTTAIFLAGAAAFFTFRRRRRKN